MTWQILDVINVLALWCMLHLLMSWQSFGVMELFDNMTHFVTSWRTFWRNVELYDGMVCFLRFVGMTYF